MAEKIQKNDFIVLDYTGKLTDGTVFDTTLEDVAKKNGLATEKRVFSAAKICVGEGQILPGLDEKIVGKEVGSSFTANLTPEEAFGKRDIKKIKIVPASTFKEHKVQPYPGLQIDVDGEMGLVTRIAGGRIMVNFNHPLAGKEVIYDVVINKKIIDPKEKIVSFLNTTLRLPEDKVAVEITENSAVVEIPFELPPQFVEAFGKKIAEMVGLKEARFKVKEKK